LIKGHVPFSSSFPIILETQNPASFPKRGLMFP
jgi:hypothetical protein